MAEKDAPTHPWLIDRRDFLLIIVSVFFIISSITLFICHRHHAIEVEQTLEKDRSDANLLSLILEQRAMAAITFLLFMSIVLFLAYLRKQVTTQHIREQLQTEKKIRAGVERYKRKRGDILLYGAILTGRKSGIIKQINPSDSGGNSYVIVRRKGCDRRVQTGH
ncbi:hypothetical protein [Desulfobacterium sp. N47]|uniref:Uncharacterized protein n=1 Tax=uncultured Desulfobacterium sp. TaxID=201089 RepID=E1YDX9_9BACT|nr:unknown protein [uncultured Desulfobacterium sp.]